MVIVPEHSLFVVRHKLIMQKYLPKHNYNEYAAMEFNGRLGIVLSKIQSKIDSQIYKCLVGNSPIELGRSWLEVISDLT